MSRVIVAGHLCLDIIPEILTSTSIEPGQLVDTGPSILSTGGVVSNVGLALKKLGADVSLVAKIGEDAFGDAISRFVRGYGEGLDAHLSRTNVAQTSYSIVISQPGRDRTFLHHPGCNHFFGAEDVDFNKLPKSDWFHFGYPPLMRRMFADGGDELADIFTRAKQKGLTTSLDMSLPDSAGESGRAKWPQILAKVLPYVDFFMPSEEEAAVVTSSEEPAQKALDWGAKNVVLKCGDSGLLWTDGTTELHQPVFPVEIVGTTGSGDATIAGFIYGMTNGYSIEESMKIGCAVGACCCEATDALSGIQNWETTRKRFAIQQPLER
jgi:sugar/nucleoside kinase (ribokinase family)